MIDTAKDCFEAGIRQARDGNRVGRIGSAVSKLAHERGFGVVRDLTGHGIGRDLHEEPSVPNYRRFLPGMKLRKGMTICVEPMLTLGTWQVGWLDDEWTVVTLDGEPAAHYENTIIVTDGEPEVITRL